MKQITTKKEQLLWYLCKLSLFILEFVEAVKEVLDMSLKDCEFPASTLGPNFNSENKVSFKIIQKFFILKKGLIIGDASSFTFSLSTA